MLIDDRTISTASKLRDRFADSVITPADDGYDQARGSFNLLHDQRPEAIATPSSAAETAAIIAAARDAGLRVTAQGSSHNVAPLGSLEGTLLIKLERMRGVALDAAKGTARVEAGARWWDLLAQLARTAKRTRYKIGTSREVGETAFCTRPNRIKR
jgi:FAD/FMN-containing dehydrogenase